MKKKNKVVKGFLIGVNVIFYLFILVLIVFSFANMQKKNTDDFPNVFGYGYMNVLTDSMTGKKPDSLNKGDLVWVRTLSKTERQNLQIGQVVCFWDAEKSMLISHRIVDKTTVQNGEVAYITRGDIHEFRDGGKPYDPEDPWADIRKPDGTLPEHTPPTFETIHNQNVRGLVIGIAPGVGNSLAYVSSPTGFFVCIVIPAIVFLGYELIILVRAIMGLQKEKFKTVAADEKETLRQQLLEEIRQEERKKLLEANKAPDEENKE